MEFDDKQEKQFRDVCDFLQIVGTTAFRAEIDKEQMVDRLMGKKISHIHASFLDEMRQVIDQQSVDIGILMNDVKKANEAIDHLIRIIQNTQQHGLDSLHQIKYRRGIS